MNALSDAELWAQALAIEALLGNGASNWLGSCAVELYAAGDEAGVLWLRDMHVRLEKLGLPHPGM